MFSTPFSIWIAQKLNSQSIIYPSQFCMSFEGSGHFPEDMNHHFIRWGHYILSRQPNITLSCQGLGGGQAPHILTRNNPFVTS